MPGRMLRALMIVAGIHGLVAQDPFIGIEDENGSSVSLSGGGDPAKHQHLEYSNDLFEWFRIHSRVEDPQWTWTDQFQPSPRPRFYRLRQNPPVVDPNTPGLILSPPDLGLGFWYETNWEENENPVDSEEAIRFHKFVIVLDDLPKVYFMPDHSVLHYDYVRTTLPPYLGINLQEFGRISEPGPDAELLLGTLAYSASTGEVGVSFVGGERYHVESLRFFIDTVAEAISPDVIVLGRVAWSYTLDLDLVFYFPGLGQQSLSNEEKAWLADHQIQVGSLDDWYHSNVCYSDGFAMGRLRYFMADEIEQAFLDGELLPTDILITDVVPAELPPLAGVITLQAINPGSHPVILARSFNLPMANLYDEEKQQELIALQGSEILLTVNGGEACRIHFAESSAFPEAMKTQIWDLKTPPSLEIQEIVPYGSIAVSNLENLTDDSIQHVGGKAANFHYLRKKIPDLSPEAMAFTFDLWTSYLDQELVGALTLREEISARLSTVTWPPNIPELEAKLEEIRDLFKDDADFNISQKQEILSALSSFPEDIRLRFRSSTNVEDADQFVGAGLYSSFSGCVRDDTDGDEVGPSHCDPTRENERGVFRAMKKVYASFYNLNAYLERLRYGLEGPEVGMAILVHPSFPDEIEAANGVAIIEEDRSLTFISQLGAVSVTNPEDGLLPEIVHQPSAGSMVVKNFSEINPEVGSTVMTWTNDYEELVTAIRSLQLQYMLENGGQSGTFDVEYKKLVDGSLVIKQFRKIPKTSQEQGEPDILIFTGDTGRFEMLEGADWNIGFDSVFSKHRLKASLELQTIPQIFDEASLESPFFTMKLDVLEGDEFTEYLGDPLALPGANYQVDENGNWVTLEWSGVVNGEAVTYLLKLILDPRDEEGALAVMSAEEIGVTLTVAYSNPKTFVTAGYWPDPVGTTLEDVIVFEPKAIAERNLGQGARQKRVFETESGVTFEDEYFLSPLGGSLPPFYVSDFRGWVSTTITGLTTQPISFTGNFSRTHWVSRHNLVEYSILEPSREVGLSAVTKQELADANIYRILLTYSRDYQSEFAEHYPPEIYLISESGELTPLPVASRTYESEYQ